MQFLNRTDELAVLQRRLSGSKAELMLRQFAHASGNPLLHLVTPHDIYK